MGEDTLGESFRTEGGRRRRSPAREALGERSSIREEWKKEEEERGPRWLKCYSPKGVSLVNALLYYKGADSVGVLLSMWHDTLGPDGSLRHHCLWCPVAHLGRQDGWRPMLGSRYRNCFRSICENYFKNGQNEKITGGKKQCLFLTPSIP
jgi:hypothetical protein